jgi:hypothetical protein
MLMTQSVLVKTSLEIIMNLLFIFVEICFYLEDNCDQ